MENDIEMVCQESSIEEGRVVGCNVKNTLLIEDFAKINHIFCDKTGTLTKNLLIFKSMALGEKVYNFDQDKFSEASELVN